MPRQTVASWFEAHPTAEADAKTARSQGQSWRDVVRMLRHRYDYPMADHTSVLAYGRDWPTAPPADTAPRHPAPIPTFTRTDADLAKLAQRETFFVTSAPNNVDADEGFLRALGHWQNETDGAVLVNKILYRNPTRRQDEQGPDEDVWWDPRFEDWMLEQELRPHPLLSIMTTKAAATAANPLPPRMDGLTKDRSAVFGHPQLSMRTVAAPHLPLPKILYSSGAATVPSYSDTVAGTMAEFHHSVGGVIVEVRGDRFHLREVVWDGECFIDVDRRYSAKGATRAPRMAALIPGDIHVGLDDLDVLRAVFGAHADSLCSVTRPREIFLHDLFNATACGQHDRSAIQRALRWQSQTSNVVGELVEVGEWVQQWVPDFAKAYVPYSNHDDMLDRWAHRGEKDVEPENLPFHWRLKADIMEHHRDTGEYPNTLEMALQQVAPEAAERLTFLGPNDSHRVRNIECALHGDRGANGARGGAAALARLATRVAAGHSHSPVIWQGVYLAGVTARLQHGYNRGPSGWLQTMAGIHDNGRRQMFHVIDGHYRG